jgi:hypothetical protein
MYRCHFCKAVVREGVSAHRVVLETRRAEYPRRKEVRTIKKGRKNDRKKGRVQGDPGGRGKEIVREVLACRSCAFARSRAIIPVDTKSVEPKRLAGEVQAAGICR